MAININPNLLRSCANDLESVVATLDDVNSVMKVAHEDISTCWQSDWTPEYLEHFEDVHSKVADVLSEIQSIQSALRNTASRAEQADREAKQIWDNRVESVKDGIQKVVNGIKSINK